uniref:Uncharacterized protein n=1 Tax=Kalanchoe fedtschenkoi TaxID=63787 RepID=A0A7N0UYR4_KALFE
MMRHSFSSQVAPESIITAVDCQNQVRSWRLLRSLMEFLIPTCSCAFVEEHEAADSNKMIHHHHQNITYMHQPSSKRHAISIKDSTEVIGTMYSYRGGKMCFSVQTSHNSSPALLLELAVPRKTLAREMQGGVLHIELKNETSGGGRCDGLVWSMYCNGKRVGEAVKRRAGVEDLEMMGLMGWVESGAGTIHKGRREVVYLRARFQRERGPFDVESFHLIDPEGRIGQELSITFHP